MESRPPCPARPGFHARALHAAMACVVLAATAPVGAQTVTLKQGGKDVRIAVGDEAVLPADFPRDIPLPEPHAVVRVERKETTTTVVIEAAGDIGGQGERLRAGMLAAGWAAARVRTPPSGVAQAWVKDGRVLVAWLTPADTGIRMQLELMPRP